MKVAIIGANGQLGTSLANLMEASGIESVRLTREHVDVADPDSVQRSLEGSAPDVVINTAAFHKVDLCEDEPEQSFAVNAVGARNVASVCRELGAKVVFISTDYVFDGEKRTPYIEKDYPRPLSVYGASKLAGEHITRLTFEKHFVIRTTGLYGFRGRSGKGGNFVETVLRFVKDGKRMTVVNDQVLTPTSTEDLARAMLELIQTEEYGLYHITNGGQCSWYEFAVRVSEFSGCKGDIVPITSAEFGAKAKRPPYSVLDNSRLREAGLEDLRPWQEALAEHMEKRMRM